MKRILIIVLALIMNISVTSCKPPGDINKTNKQGLGEIVKYNNDDLMDKGPVKGGVINLFSTIPDTLNPVITTNAYVQDFSSLIYESLVKIDKNQKPIPLIADKWDVSLDGLTWTFHIRDNVMWHDNMPLTAEDVEFTVDTILRSNISTIYKKNVQNITTFAAVDKNTFRIILKKPYSFTAEQMTFPILPKHYFIGEDIVRTSRNMSPIGTGPFRFSEYNDKSYIKLVSNDNWWNSNNQNKSLPNLPYIAEVNIKIFENSRNSINAFQTRDIDVTTINSVDHSKYSGRSDLTIRKYPGRNYDYIAFNLGRAALNDKAVRQAIAYALDKTKLINDVMPGEAVASDLPIVPGTWLYDTNILSYNKSVAKAKDLLQQNGWREDRDLMYKYINGYTAILNLELLVNSDNEIRVKAAEKIAEQLKEINVNLRIKKVSWEEELRLINSKSYEMALIGCSISSIPDISFMYSTGETYGGMNVAGYSNQNVDNYLEQIQNEVDDNRKKALFINMKEIINTDQPYLGLYFYNNAVLYNKRVRGEFNPYFYNKFNDIAKWYVPIR